MSHHIRRVLSKTKGKINNSDGAAAILETNRGWLTRLAAEQFLVGQVDYLTRAFGNLDTAVVGKLFIAIYKILR